LSDGPSRGADGLHGLQFDRYRRFERSVAPPLASRRSGRRRHLARKRETGSAPEEDRKAPEAPKTAAPQLPVEPPVTLARLRHYRKLTKAVSVHLRAQLGTILETLTPLFHAEAVFGDYVQKSVLSLKPDVEAGPRAQLAPDRWGRGSELNVKREAAAPPTVKELQDARKYAKANISLKEAVKGADRAFGDLESLYDGLAKKRPYDLGIGLTPPLPINTSALEIFPLDYPYVVRSERQNKRVMVTAPLTWIVTYAGFSLSRLRALIADPNRSRDELQRVLTHHLLLHVVLERKSGLHGLLQALNFPARTERMPEFGDLPLTVITSAVKTERPPDDVILESTDLSGVDATEEIVRVTNVAGIADSRRARLLEIVEAEKAGANGDA
jgi:hypothetical protein